MEPFVPGDGAPDALLTPDGTDPLGIIPELESPPEAGTEAPEPAPATAEARKLELTEEQAKRIAQDLAAFCDEYDGAMEGRWKVCDQILAAYDMEHRPEHASGLPGGAKLCSELTKSLCDQTKARLVQMMMDTRPLMRMAPVDPEAEDEESREKVKEAKAAEQFYEAYARDEIDQDTVLPSKTMRSAQVGCGVTYDIWRETESTVRFWGPDGEVREETSIHAGICSELIPDLRDFIIWPLNIEDWQKARYAGHRSRGTRAEFLAKCAEWGTAPEIAEKVEKARAENEADRKSKKREGVETSQVQEDSELISWTELWVHGKPHEDLPLDYYQFIFNEDCGEMLFADYNPHHKNKHPYQLLRYKRKPGFVLGEGVGHELRYAQAAGSMLDNLTMDSLRVQAFDLLIMNKNEPDLAGQEISIKPGAKLWAENPEKAIVAVRLGGSLQHLRDEKQDNRYRAMSVTGLPSVLQGLGDPTMKSGADATSVQALIAEAGKKFGDVDKTMKRDLEAQATYHMELVFQFGHNGIWYERLSREKGAHLEAARMRYVPPRALVEKTFRVVALAPSAATNREQAKQHILILYNMTMQHLQIVERLATEVYSGQKNPAMILDVKEKILGFLNKLLARIYELHETEGLSPDIPGIEQPTPVQEMLGALMQENQELQAAIQQLQQQIMGASPPEGGNGAPAGLPAQ